jgi:hypothetical protein
MRIPNEMMTQLAQDRIDLELQHFAIAERISNKLFFDVAVDVDRCAAYVTMRALHCAYGRKAQPITFSVSKSVVAIASVECPSDWWQHFKQRWFPSWALRKWPVKMTVIRDYKRNDETVTRTIEPIELFPHIAVRDDRSRYFTYIERGGFAERNG